MKEIRLVDMPLDSIWCCLI